MKHILKLSAALSLLSLASCLSHEAASSANPVADAFTYAGNGIGNAVNKVIPTTQQPTTIPQQAPHTYTVPQQ